MNKKNSTRVDEWNFFSKEVERLQGIPGNYFSQYCIEEAYNAYKLSGFSSWKKFSDKVKNHIIIYTIPQYGDKGDDLISKSDFSFIQNNIEKYKKRQGKNMRASQDLMDLFKTAHYACMGYVMLEENSLLMNNSVNKKNLTKKYYSDAGFDVKSAEDCIIESLNKQIVRTGLSVAIPNGYTGLLRSRSGLASQYDLEVGAGVIDSSYRGQIKIVLRNFSNYPVRIKKGDKIAQLIVIPVKLGYFKEVQTLPESQDNRGANGFGSTGI